MIGAAIAYNLKKFTNYRERKVKVVAIELRKKENQSGVNNIFSFFNRRNFRKIIFGVIDKKSCCKIL